MSAISSISNVQSTSPCMKEALPIDQKTQNKVYAVALVVIKAIAIAIVAVSVFALTKGNPTALPGVAFLTTFFAITLFSKPNSNTPSYSRPRDEEWKKEARADREFEALKNTQEPAKIAKISKDWHNGNDSNFVAVGTRRA